MQSIQFIDRQTQQIITENPPAEKLLRFLYHTTVGKISLEMLIKRKLVSKWYGKRMSRPRSKSKIQKFVDDYQIDMSESIKSINEFHSFNDFFYRHLKPSSRPISDGLVSPADGKILAFETVREIRSFYVKGMEFELASFLKDQQLAQRFSEASMFIIRLAPNDYHRFHFPYKGIPQKAVPIKGFYYSVSPYAVVPNFTKVFCENKREYVLLDTYDKGTLLLCPVGATMVGSIFETFTPQKNIEKGEEMGYFAFGGSSILMLVDRKYIQIDADLLENTRNGMETAVRMGEKIAY